MTAHLLLLSLPFLSSTAYANLTPKPHIGPAGIEFQSSLDLDYGYDDNVNFQSEKTPNIESDFFNVKPLLQLKGVRGADIYTLQYLGDYRQYQKDSTSDNYDDHTIRFIGAWKKGFNNDLLFTIENKLGHENRGEGLTEGFINQEGLVDNNGNPVASFNKYGIDNVLKTNMFNTELRYSIDKQDSIGKLSFAVQYKDFNYDDRSSNDIHQHNFNQYIKDQNWDQTTFTVELFDQASSRTRFRYSIISNLRDYDEDTQKNTNETFFVAGIKTQQTGKTTIDANIAWLYKTFPNQPDSEDFRGLNWDIDLAWSPVRYSTFHLFTDQSVEDPTEIGGYVLKTKYGTRWQHFGWSNRLSTELGFNYEISADKNQDDGKTTTTTDIIAKLTYKFRPSIILELSYQQLINESDKEFDDFEINDSAETIIQTLGYDKSIIMFTTKVQI
ncbi:TetR family transcriptional regulator [Aliivibrio sifiae]|uniref:TetR family transcriptional regulator n=1 Tax=Aliivibrio sifiae TaxID=566293 RepID=A0A2S7XFJ0_9GAMM|nr:TetR family transcriptional regulator [Aliivibrio sifiae]